jgi:hypothetical protein
MRRLVPLLAVVFFVSACGLLSQSRAPVLGDDDVTGTWHTSSGAVLTFRADGTFDATDLPYQLFTGFGKPVLPDGFDPQHDQLPAAGSWKVDHNPAKTAGPRTHVVLHVFQLAGRPQGIEVAMVGRERDGHLELYFFVGDPDSNDLVVYQKDAPPS